MNKQDSLFKSHINLAHRYWRELLVPGDIVIDATCGNGKDSLCLAQLAIKNNTGQLYCLDVQAQAIESTQNYLKKHLAEEDYLRICFMHGCHSAFPQNIKPKTVKLIVYNLGYLPSGNKELTTQTTTTLLSIQNALDLIIPGGMISITCYPGHAEGAIEEINLLKFAASLSPQIWSCCHHKWVNRMNSPSLLLLQKAFTPAP